MKDRLKQLRKSLKLTQGEFGEKIGMTDASVSHMESGRTAFSNQNVKLICLTFGVREEWLREGKGEMFDDEALLSDCEKHILEQFRKLSTVAQKMLIEYVNKLWADEQALRRAIPMSSLDPNFPLVPRYHVPPPNPDPDPGDFPLVPRRPVPAPAPDSAPASAGIEEDEAAG